MNTIPHPEWTQRENVFTHSDTQATIYRGSYRGDERWILRVVGYQRPLAVHVDTPEFLMRFYAQTMGKK